MRIRPPGSAGPVPVQLWLLVGSMALIELVLSAADRGWIGTPFWRAIAFGYGAFWQSVLSGAEQPIYAAQPYLMFLSHAFLHGDLLHFVLNGVILLALGKFISQQVGPWAMLLVFAVSAVAGGLAYAALSGSAAPMVGASGAVFGFIGLWQYWEYAARRARGLTLKPVYQMLAGLVVINLVLAVMLQGGLAWQAHLGGFVAGVALGPAMTRVARARAAARM